MQGQLQQLQQPLLHPQQQIIVLEPMDAAVNMAILIVLQDTHVVEITSQDIRHLESAVLQVAFMVQPYHLMKLLFVGSEL